MAVQKVKLKRPEKASASSAVAPTAQEEADARERTVKLVLEALRAGEFDGDLDVLYEALDERIRWYQKEEGEPDQDPRERAEKLKVLRSPQVIPVEGRLYRVRGEKYAGVTVKFLELVPQQNGDAPKSLVEVALAADSGLENGKLYKLPTAALEEVPEMKVAAPKKPPYGYSLKPCKQCGGDVEYSGKGRPQMYCAECRGVNKIPSD
jgi:hypothetical protein